MKPKIALFVCAALVLTGCHHKQVSSTTTVSISSTAPPTKASAAAADVPDLHPFALKAHIGPAKLYPNQDLTPGKADTLNADDLTSKWTHACPRGKTECTYSESHRNVSAGVHTKVYDEYKVPSNERNIQDGEVDHLVPLCAGGSNDIENLWYQPAENKWKGKNFGFHEKDNLEKWICREIKAGRVNPKTAYDRIRADWVAYYLDLNLNKENEGQDEEID